MWRHGIDLLETEDEFEKCPDPDTDDHREESGDGVYLLQDDRHSEWDECSGKSYLVSVFYHFEDPSFFMIVLIRHEAHDNEEKPNYRSSSHEKCFFI